MMRPLGRLGAAALGLAALTALAADSAPLGRELVTDPQRQAVRPEVFQGMVVAPIPISNPTIGTGLGVVAMPFYRLGPRSPLSNTVVAAGYTTSGSWGVGAAQSTRLDGDRLRLDGFLGYVDMRYRFYGVGSRMGAAGVSAPVAQRGFAFVPELLLLVGNRLYVGVRYRAAGVRMSPEETPQPALAPFFSGGAADDFSSGFGPIASFDTRDNDMNPSAGSLIEFKANFANRGFGGDADYRQFTLAANHYLRAGKRGVLALRGYGCRTTPDTPLFDLCLYGAGSDLRGYDVGRYRDRALLAAQAEYRFPVRGRLGAALFGGAGKVGDSFGSLGAERSLPSAGFGVRVLASRATRVNLSVDYARGRDSDAWYIYVKEAF
jgi:hypothetical protein